jgi:putative ABC transport system ATP-binding protein
MLQNAHLFPSLTALENVEIPLRLMRMEPVERTKRAILALEQVHLGARLCIRGLELSGSEQQRVALARALVHGPQLLVADEPTGILDSMTGREFILLLREIAHGSNVGVLVATHDPAVVSVADRVLDINDGRITQEQ